LNTLLVKHTLQDIKQMTKKVNAEEFRKRPRDVYEAANSGETVLINHDRYRKVFELTARDREPLKDTVIDPKDQVVYVFGDQTIEVEGISPDGKFAFERTEDNSHE